ncbi:MAG: hypothetical protein NDJ94_19240 [Vicinamibacteria bacterium]|nr:hypothetical protein [Vicinamibacteria bacterium]
MRLARTPWLGQALATAAVAVAGAVAAPATEPPAPRAPQRLSETGLYGPIGIRSVAPGVEAFVPQYPLWTDGARKSRWIQLPQGARIDVTDVDAWRFPTGTKLWKEFAWGERKVETRLIWKATDSGWVFATYVWNDEQTDAVLAPETGVPQVLEVAPGKRHSIPAIADCLTCHGLAPSPVLGFSALQLSDDRDPLAPHAEPLPKGAVTLRTLVGTDRLAPRRPELAQNPPRIRERDPVARAALGYLSANCGGCHNDRGPLARLGLVLLHDVTHDDDRAAPEPAHATTVDTAGRYVVPGLAPEDSRRVAPGAPDRSALLHRLRSRRPSSQMPPLGSVVADEQAIALVRSWIESLGPTRAAAH